MNVSLRSLNLSTIEEIISYYLPTFNQLFFETRTMNEDCIEQPGREGFVGNEEVVISVDSLMNEDDNCLNEKSDSFKNKEDNAAIPKISVCQSQNAITGENKIAPKCALNHFRILKHGQQVPTSVT